MTDESRTDEVPTTLSATGLYADITTGTLGDDVLAFEPQFPLWSDGAEKSRWVWLPPDTRIDTTDMDAWEFPAGTRFWKEFRRDGVRIETRLLVKRGDDDWLAVAYRWTADQRDAVAVPFGVVDANGTTHDIPAAGECAACHGGRRSFVLGFSAIQLSGPAVAGMIDLDGLIAAQRLSAPPAGKLVVPGTADERAALGYLHANCSHCHNQTRPASAPCFDPDRSFDFSLEVGDLATPADTAVYRTAIGEVIEPGHPDDSAVIRLMSRRGLVRQMPPLATEQIDDAAVAQLRRWITNLEVEP
ncbi:MAG TPA: hypothetical protein VFQ53_36690 [Kofleriaceae bacterium]|nr:hypothetical protein [Kofleriaceae bacterium]